MKTVGELRQVLQQRGLLQEETENLKIGQTQENDRRHMDWERVGNRTAYTESEVALPIDWLTCDSRTVRECAKGGYSLSRKRVSPLNPREKGRGAFPFDPTHWQFQS